MKFLLDHDVPEDLTYLLHELGHEFVRLRDVLPQEAADALVLSAAREQGCLLITCNRDDFIQLATRQAHHGIIVIIRRRTRAAERAALRRRRPAVGLIFHSDRGSEYLGAAFRHRLAARGVRQSMTRGGAPGENAHIESFFHSFKADLIHGCRWPAIGELRRQLRWYLPFYNHQRLHSALGYQSPVDYERRAA